jgi:hypothetical protein
VGASWVVLADKSIANLLVEMAFKVVDVSSRRIWY